MTFYENVLTALILLGILVLGYLKMTNKTLVEFIKEIKEVFSSSSEVVEGGLVAK